ncbi:DUF1937 family protein [Pseudoroseicyclus aestuarii]|uniref:Uncharacterized protein DUF1937 n=1 Tax=Pseudoroseicyclus aestuarii TaxID=1795041 RepID=A0A318ST53_9RHOB|nr:DUF1937 family protein [Pseudoroseicyclus aestuarii]PYE81307.1 uncharacterized protein DUF1937 [Pseudoroseicyclus aestuarii]
MSMHHRLPRDPDWPQLCARYTGSGLLQRDVALIDAAQALRGSLAYLATPYTRQSTDDNGRWCPSLSCDLSDAAAAWCSRFAQTGVTAVSPVVQADAMLQRDPWGDALDPLDEHFWSTWCRPLLSRCDAVVIPPLPGWDCSAGVWAEACAAVTRQRRVILIGAEPEGPQSPEPVAFAPSAVPRVPRRQPVPEYHQRGGTP